MSNVSVLEKARASLARIGVAGITQAPPSHGALPPQPEEPVLDGRHIAIGSADDENGHYDILFEPYAACEDRDGKPQEAGTYYHAGYVFHDAHQSRMERRVGYKGTGGSASIEYTKRPINVADVKHFIAIWRLDDLDISWKYLPCEVKERNFFHVPGDAS